MKFFSSRKNRQREAELDAELQSHLDESIRERADRGQPHRDANFAARVEFGNVGLVRETTRDNWGGRSLEILAARHSLRTSHPPQESRLCRNDHRHAGSRHRRKRRNLQRPLRRATETASLSRSFAPRHD